MYSIWSDIQMPTRSEKISKLIITILIVEFVGSIILGFVYAVPTQDGHSSTFNWTIFLIGLFSNAAMIIFLYVFKLHLEIQEESQKMLSEIKQMLNQTNR